VLNRVDKVTLTYPSPATTGRYIDYTYNATGQLLRKRQYDNSILQKTTDYIDGFIYTTAGAGAAQLDYFGMPEGRVRNTGGSTITLKQEFIITDHQGNARISFEDNGSGVALVKQENSYYAYGMSMTSTMSPPTAPNKNLYNGGSEWQNDYVDQPDWQQTFYRNYDATIGRFLAADPMAEATGNMSVYQYGNNNPVLFNDPLGNLAGDIISGVYQQHGAERDFQEWVQGVSINLGGYGGSSNRGSNVHITNSNVISAIFTNLALGNNVNINLGDNGEYKITYSNALISLTDPDNNSGEDGVIAWGDSKGDYGSTSTKINKANQGGIGILFVGANLVFISPFYPPNDGFVGPVVKSNSQVGDILLRRGETSGRFYTRPGTAPEETSLPPGTNTTIERYFKVVKEFEQTVGKAAAWFNQPGGGTQVQTNMTTDQLLEGEFIEPIEPIEPFIIP
jgi:RHS repeat-associated protein